MNELLEAQRAIRTVLERCGGTQRFFLRLSDGDDALWVTDWPMRTMGQLAQARDALALLKVVCRAENSPSLLHLDFSKDGYLALIKDLPQVPPALTTDDTLHPALALCRLWLSHPTPLEKQPLAPLRQVLKYTRQPRAVMLRSISGLHKQAAEQLRNGCCISHTAGRVLAQWLMEQDHLS